MSEGARVLQLWWGWGPHLAAILGLPMVVAEGPPQQAEVVGPSLFLSLEQKSWA